MHFRRKLHAACLSILPRPQEAFCTSALPGFLFLLAPTLVAIVFRGLLAGVAELNEQVAR